MKEPRGDILIFEVEAVIVFEPTLKDCGCESVVTLEVALAGEIPDREEANEVVATPEETVPLEDKAVMDAEADADAVTISSTECIERLLATCATTWTIADSRLSPAAVAVIELAEILRGGADWLPLLLRLAVVSAVVIAAEVAPVALSNISVPST